MAGTDLPPDPGPIAAFAQFAEPRRWLEFIEGQRAQIEAQTRRLQELEGREAERRDALERLDLAERELASSRSLRHQLQEAQKDAEALRERQANPADLAELQQLRMQLEAVKASRSWQATSRLRRLRP